MTEVYQTIEESVEDVSDVSLKFLNKIFWRLFNEKLILTSQVKIFVILGGRS